MTQSEGLELFLFLVPRPSNIVKRLTYSEKSDFKWKTRFYIESVFWVLSWTAVDGQLLKTSWTLLSCNSSIREFIN